MSALTSFTVSIPLPASVTPEKAEEALELAYGCSAAELLKTALEDALRESKRKAKGGPLGGPLGGP